MSKWWLLSAATGLWMAVGYAMVRSPAVDGPRTGHSHSPARIVSMAPSLTETLFALGLEPNVVGVTQDSDYPPAARDKPRVGTFWQPNIEAVIATRPDLVVTQTFEQQRDLARRLGRMGYNSLMVDVETIDELFDSILVLGQATGTSARAGKLCADMRAEIGRLAAATARARRVKVLWVVQREPLRVAGRATFINEMIELAGGENAIGPTLHIYPAVGAEQVIAARPEVIIEPAMMPGALEQQRHQALAYWSRFTNVPAVATGRIYVIEGDLVSRLSPRLPAGIETIARCLHPDLFGD
jgi:iron complex transport system substrate-binding protein